MGNDKNNSKLTLIRKVADVFINIGDIHTNQLSIGAGFYEPKISIHLLKNNEKIIK